MKKKIILLPILLIIFNICFSQTYIKANNNYGNIFNRVRQDSAARIPTGSTPTLWTNLTGANASGHLFYSTLDSTLYVHTGSQFISSFFGVTSKFWSLTGNTGTVAGTNFIGTKDAVDWVIKTNNTERARVTSSGTATFIKDALVNGLTVGRGGSSFLANTAIGNSALFGNTTGVSLTSIGYQSLYSNTTGNANTANGYQSLYSNTTGGFNTSTGILSMFSNTTGSNNTANGSSALYLNTTGTANTATGGQALRSNTTGNENTANGYSALFQNTIGVYNTASGHSALVANTSGNYNTADGHSALFSNTTGDYNAGFGYGTLLLNTSGVHNAAFGTGSLAANTIGVENTATGNRGLAFNTLGNKNTANGYQAAYNNTEGSFNTISGHSALYVNQFGNNNSVFGYEALKQIVGDNNTMVGIGSAGVTTGDNLTLLGNFSVNPLPAVTSNHVEIRDGAGNLAFKRDINNNTRINVQALQVVNVSAAATLTLNAEYSDYVFSGTSTTWTLPPLTGYTNVKYFIKNRGTGAITLNSNAGGNDIYTTSAVNTFTINAGAAYILMNDGTYWDVE